MQNNPLFFFPNQKSLYTAVIYLFMDFKDLEKRKADTDLGLEKHTMKEILYVYVIKTWPLFFWSFKIRLRF